MRKLFLILVALLPAWAIATTTSGPTSRNILIDGNVTIGAANGTNGTVWEMDEVFQGFSNIINWYLSWDDQNLYLGRIGGNNAEGSVLYVRAEYTSYQTTNRGFAHDFLEPEVSPMGGINFSTYIKDSYDEFRIWSGGAWGAANTSLTPQFSTQGGNSHMEVAIPWNAITNSNGLPSNLRLVIYQVTPNVGVPACTPNNHFVYAESPWGTGLFGDGPSVAVNDGLPFSLRQPGGCGVGQDTATRWWGCYPTSQSVSPNSWNFTQSSGTANVISSCLPSTSIQLSGSNPATTGLWSILSQPPNSGQLTFSSPNTSQTMLLGATASGTYKFLFQYQASLCGVGIDTVILNIFQPSQVLLGSDTTICPSDIICLGALNSTSFSNFQWSNGDTLSTTCINANGCFTLTGTDINGCQSSDTINILTLAPPPSASMLIDSSNCPTINYYSNSTGLVNTYAWDLGGGFVGVNSGIWLDYSQLGSGTYLVTLVVGNECGLDTAIEYVTINCTSRIQSQLASCFNGLQNPITDLLFLPSCTEIIDNCSVLILDANSRVVYEAIWSNPSSHDFSFQTEHLKSGLYYLLLRDSKQLFNKTFIKFQ